MGVGSTGSGSPSPGGGAGTLGSSGTAGWTGASGTAGETGASGTAGVGDSAGCGTSSTGMANAYPSGLSSKPARRASIESKTAIASVSRSSASEKPPVITVMVRTPAF